MKIRKTISNDLDLNEYYLAYDPEQLRGFIRRSDTLLNANAGDTVILKYHNSKTIL